MNSVNQLNADLDRSGLALVRPDGRKVPNFIETRARRRLELHLRMAREQGRQLSIWPPAPVSVAPVTKRRRGVLVRAACVVVALIGFTAAIAIEGELATLAVFAAAQNLLCALRGI